MGRKPALKFSSRRASAFQRPWMASGSSKGVRARQPLYHGPIPAPESNLALGGRAALGVPLRPARTWHEVWSSESKWQRDVDVAVHCCPKDFSGLEGKGTERLNPPSPMAFSLVKTAICVRLYALETDKITGNGTADDRLLLKRQSTSSVRSVTPAQLIQDT